MKAVLIIDIPESCERCPLHYFKQGDYCCPTRKLVDYDYDMDCPLRPIPQKMRTDEDDIEEDSYWQGWNDCIDALVNGEV